MKKKFLAVVLGAAMTLSMAACGIYGKGAVIRKKQTPDRGKRAVSFIGTVYARESA